MFSANKYICFYFRNRTVKYNIITSFFLKTRLNNLHLKIKEISLQNLSWKQILGTVFPHIVSSLEYFPPLNSFLTSVRKLFKFLLHKGKINEETISNFQGLKIQKKNSCRGNYMRKYGIYKNILGLKTVLMPIQLYTQHYFCHLLRLHCTPLTCD